MSVHLPIGLPACGVEKLRVERAAHFDLDFLNN